MPFKGGTLFFLSQKMTVNSYASNSGKSLLHHSECAGPKNVCLRAVKSFSSLQQLETILISSGYVYEMI